MTLVVPWCEAVCISDWDGQESHPLGGHRLAALQRHWRESHKYPLRVISFPDKQDRKVLLYMLTHLSLWPQFLA
ncbi:hypothetical protein PBY51_007912 [Eleginops maclovinus]|uniref:Uncharacterized protein n=1 Tax=Eleginops maclovinus TaxID=56733 RepID=A0AAN8AHL7_ELEMC|nr:hypothetical protein PBY51_007912 [Eleginops maclovinus]